MVFTSVNFFIFLFVLLLAYYLTPQRHRWLTLLLASYFFYINTKPVFALLLAGVTGSTYLFTTWIAKAKTEKARNWFKIINIILILLPLFFFKYFGAVNEGLIGMAEQLHLRWPLPEMKLMMPVGISFYTFMAIGYTIDVFNEEVEVEKNPGMVALFISFFPLILSGPIERAKNMLWQFRALKNPDYAMVTHGLRLMLWGFFLKLVVADRLGIYVDAVYHNVQLHNGTTLLYTAILYPFQVYADLGGYSLIAIGVAALLGIKVMHNFNRPFFASSMAEFWRRWHMSLITWLTDYVYTPLSFAFRKLKVKGIVLSLMITFLISGIWHGASLTFLAWGILQGLYLSAEALTTKQKTNLERKFKLTNKSGYIFLSCVVTFILFAISQVFARASSFPDAMLVFSKIVSGGGALFIGVPSIFIFGLLGIALMMLSDFREEYLPGRFLLFDHKYKPVRIAAYSITIILILMIGVFDGGEFIYFQF